MCVARILSCYLFWSFNISSSLSNEFFFLVTKLTHTIFGCYAFGTTSIVGWIDGICSVHDIHVGNTFVSLILIMAPTHTHEIKPKNENA